MADADNFLEHTVLPSADTPEPDYEPGDLLERPEPRTTGQRVNPHRVQRKSPRQSHNGRHMERGRPGVRRPVHRPAFMDHLNDPKASSPETGGAAIRGYEQQVAPAPAPIVHPSPRQPSISYGQVSLLSALGGAIILGLATIAPFLEGTRNIRLLGASTGGGNVIVIIGAIILSLAAIILIAFKPRQQVLGGVATVALLVAGFMAMFLTLYLVSLESHQSLISNGASYGPALVFLLLGSSLLLVASIFAGVHAQRLSARGGEVAKVMRTQG